MKNLKKKKGFTLIELMIVLAIIGILAVVLVPKVGSMKNSARDTGITTNANTVRAFLETRTSNKFISAPATLESTMVAEFVGSDVIRNPITNEEGITDAENSDADSAPAVFIGTTGTTTTFADGDSVEPYIGSIIVLVDPDKKSYTIYEVPRNSTTFSTLKASTTSYTVK